MQEEMAARQQYHDETKEPIDERLRVVIGAIEKDGEFIHWLAVIAEAHERRLSGLEGGTPDA